MHLDLQSYGFTTEHQQVFDTTFRYAERELHPLLPRMDDEDWFPEEAFRKMSEVGLLGVTIPTEYGGAGMDLCSQFFGCNSEIDSSCGTCSRKGHCVVRGHDLVAIGLGEQCPGLVESRTLH